MDLVGQRGVTGGDLLCELLLTDLMHKCTFAWDLRM